MSGKMIIDKYIEGLFQSSKYAAVFGVLAVFFHLFSNLFNITSGGKTREIYPISSCLPNFCRIGFFSV